MQAYTYTVYLFDYYSGEEDVKRRHIAYVVRVILTGDLLLPVVVGLQLISLVPHMPPLYITIDINWRPDDINWRPTTTSSSRSPVDGIMSPVDVNLLLPVVVGLQLMASGLQLMSIVLHPNKLCIQ